MAARWGYSLTGGGLTVGRTGPANLETGIKISPYGQNPLGVAARRNSLPYPRGYAAPATQPPQRRRRMPQSRAGEAGRRNSDRARAGSPRKQVDVMGLARTTAGYK